jgi:hypothetical protein
MAMAVLRKGLVQGKQTNLQIVRTIVGTVLDKRFGGGDCLFSGANIEGGGVAAAAAVAVTKLPGGEQEVMEWAEFLGWGWKSALRIGDALLLLQVVNVEVVTMLLVMIKAMMVVLFCYLSEYPSLLLLSILLQEQGTARELHARNEVLGSIDGNFAAGDSCFEFLKT